MGRAAVVLIFCLMIATPVLARDYFVAPKGNDSADGLTPATAKKSFAAVAPRLHPGDVMRLQRGGVWAEMLRLTASGEPKRPIRITAYGGGDLPTIDGDAPNAKQLDTCIDASVNYVVIDSLRVTHASAVDRGAVMVWAHQSLEGITIQNCEIVSNFGRGIWIAGEVTRDVRWVFIDGNTIKDNSGCGVLATKMSAGWITNNVLTGNCSKTIDPWQAAIRVWSGDIWDVLIDGNQIDNGIHHLERGAGMGIHVDEVGSRVVVSGNDIRHCDAGGIEVENARGVAVTDNVIFDAHTGVFVYRAGHDHRITNNTIVARSQGIVLQGLWAHGVDAGPEIEEDGQLLTGNVIEKNIAIANHWGSLKLTGGGERTAGQRANVITSNALGPERASLVECGDLPVSTYAALPDFQINNSQSGEPPFANLSTGDLRLNGHWANLGAQRFSGKSAR